MKSPRVIAFVMALLTVAAVPASAQRFYAANRANSLELLAKPGDAKASVIGTVRGREIKSYTFWAAAGEQVDISLRTLNPSLYFNLEPPSGNDALFHGDMMGSAQRFTGALGETGLYRITIYVMRSVARGERDRELHTRPARERRTGPGARAVAREQRAELRL